jgi:hypothetical protein
MTHFSQNILGSLKDAVVKVFWKKDDLRALFEVAEVPQSIINAQNWDLYKFKIDFAGTGQAELDSYRNRSAA